MEVSIELWKRRLGIWAYRRSDGPTETVKVEMM